MPSYRTGTVTSILSERPGLQRVEVDGERAYVLTQLIGTVAVGDRVVMNTTAVELGLGTGGWHVVHWNLARETWSEPGGGHEMKLRYTSLQLDAGSSPSLLESHPMRGRLIPVVACFLHSQVACVARAFKELQPEKRLAYVMTDGGALPLALSDLVAELQRDHTIDTTATIGHAFGGDREAVALGDALAACGDHDAIVVGMGPGSLGTGTQQGFSGIEVASILRSVAYWRRQGFLPIVAVRYSEADPRDRHRGLSHHTMTALSMVKESVTIPIPKGEDPPESWPTVHSLVQVEVPDVSSWPYTSMGRTPAEDPKFFEYAAAAGVYAAQALLD